MGANWTALIKQLCCASNLSTQNIFPSITTQCPPSFTLVVHYGLLGSTLILLLLIHHYFCQSFLVRFRIVPPISLLIIPCLPTSYFCHWLSLSDKLCQSESVLISFLLFIDFRTLIVGYFSLTLCTYHFTVLWQLLQLMRKPLSSVLFSIVSYPWNSLVAFKISTLSLMISHFTIRYLVNSSNSGHNMIVQFFLQFQKIII